MSSRSLCLVAIGLPILVVTAGCPQPPNNEIAMVRARIDETVRDFRTDSFAPALTSEAESAFADAEAAMLEKDYRLAIERAGTAARLIDEAGAVAVRQRARTRRRLARWIRDIELHLAMIDEERPELRGAPELERLRQSFERLRDGAGEEASDGSHLDEVWQLKQSLLQIDKLEAQPREG